MHLMIMEWVGHRDRPKAEAKGQMRVDLYTIFGVKEQGFGICPLAIFFFYLECISLLLIKS